jgi:hypothetical protein
MTGPVVPTIACGLWRVGPTYDNGLDGLFGWGRDDLTNTGITGRRKTPPGGPLDRRGLRPRSHILIKAVRVGEGQPQTPALLCGHAERDLESALCGRSDLRVATSITSKGAPRSAGRTEGRNWGDRIMRERIFSGLLRTCDTSARLSAIVRWRRRAARPSAACRRSPSEGGSIADATSATCATCAG